MESAGPPATGPPASPARQLRGIRIAAVGVVLLGAASMVEALGIAGNVGYSAVGPQVFPIAVAAGLLASGGLLLLRVTLFRDTWLAAKVSEEETATHWPTPALVGAALLGYALTLPLLGYIVATAVFLPAVARVLGSRSLRRDALVGLGLSAVLFFGFTEALGVRLPPGLLSFVL